MASNPVKLKARRGDTFVKEVTLKYRATGNPIILTGASISGTIKRNVGDSVVLDSFQILNRDDVNGKFDIVLDADQTAALLVNGHSDSYVFEVHVNHGGTPEFIRTYMYGTLVVGQ